MSDPDIKAVFAEIEAQEARRAAWRGDISSAVRTLLEAVLKTLGDAPPELCYNLHWVSEETGMPRELSRSIVAILRERGDVEHARGLFNEDGRVAGSGYRLTLQGHQAYLALPSQASDEAAA